MTVTKVPHELRYWVSSESRSGLEHLVDLADRDEPWSRPVARCSCERVQCGHEKYCKHIKLVVQIEKERLHL